MYLYILRKSIRILVINILIAVLVVLCTSSFMGAYSLVNKPSNGLSQNYITVNISNSEDKKIQDLIHELQDRNKEIIIYKKTEKNILGVYINGFEPDLKMIEGRMLAYSDYKEGNKVVVVSSDSLDKCFKKDDTYFYTINNILYEVVGVYEKNDNYINKTVDAFYALSSNECSYMVIQGTYYIDSTEENYGVLTDIFHVKYNKFKDITNNEKINKVLSVQGLTLISLILILFMIILNIINVTANWLNNLRREINVCRLCGATRPHVIYKLYFRYLYISSTSYIIGYFIAFLISKFPLSIYGSFKFSFAICVYIWVLFMIISTILFLCNIRSKLGKQIIESFR